MNDKHYYREPEGKKNGAVSTVRVHVPNLTKGKRQKINFALRLEARRRRLALGLEALGDGSSREISLLEARVRTRRPACTVPSPSVYIAPGAWVGVPNGQSRINYGLGTQLGLERPQNDSARQRAHERAADSRQTQR